MIYQCLYCPFSTERKYNLKVHEERKHRRKHKMESMLDNTLSSTKVKNEEKNMTTEQVDVSYSQRPAIDKDQLKKLLKNLSEEYNHKITMGEIVHDIMREEKVEEEALGPEMKEALELYVKKTMKEKKSTKKRVFLKKIESFKDKEEKTNC